MTNKKNKPQTGSAQHIIKIILLALLYGGASFFLIYSCKQIADNYLQLMLIKPEAITPLIRLGISVLLFVLSAGLAAALVRPLWLLFLVSLLPALILPFIFGFSSAGAILAGITALLAIMYMSAVEGKMNNQIKFSLRPLSEANHTLLLAATIIISAGIALGYAADMEKRSFTILPEFREMTLNYLNTQTSAAVENDESIPAELRGLAIKKSQDSIEKSWNDMERTFVPIAWMIPFYLGLIAFSVVKIAVSLIAWIPLILINAIIALLKKVNVIKLKVEMKEVSQLEI